MVIKLFGLTKTLVNNQNELSLSLSAGQRVKDLVTALDAIYPQLAELIDKKKVLVSVNQEIAHEDTPIEDSDEVALLPPFAGGTTIETNPIDDNMLVRVQRENFSVDTELDRVRSRSTRIGGISVFLGTARDRSKGRDVSGITFDYYDGMAQKKLREIRERALRDFDVIEVLIVHRYGAIEIGENIVLVIVGAEHRAEAFRACKWTIDELKQITPIWKLEQTPEGEVWVEEHP
jgi:molybdopterin synthase catalytic subunit